ncbi:MAG: hypothetical protein ACK46O_08175 [Flavobacteriia bacterium]|jgi:hypothetical protein
MRILTFFLLMAFTFGAWGQRDMTPGKRRGEVFGKADYKNYRFFGLMVAAGPTFMKTRAEGNNLTWNSVDATGRPIDYTMDPEGKPGVFAEIGLAHFPKKRSKLSLALKTVLVSYYDWGIGFKLLGGTETTTVNYYNALGDYSGSTEGNGDFYNGYLYGRFTLHKNINLSKRYFIDNGLGINFDYRLITEKDYDGIYIGQQYFHKPFVAQLHYDLGFGVKLSRRSYLIPGIQIPILGLNEWRKGCAALKWYDSNYLPILAKVKFIYLFEKKVKGCNTPGTEEDRKRNEEFLQNN